MIEEEGIVIEVREGIAIIKAERTASCEKCMSKDACKSLTDADMVVEAINPVGARAGDRVVFTVGAAALLKAGVFMYLVPLLAFIAGVVAGQVAGKSIAPGLAPDIVSAILGFAFLILTAIALYLYGRNARVEKGAMPTIVRVV